jgi:hypothetical protein
MYIRDVQKRKKEEEKEAEETKKILQQIDKAAYKQYSQDCLTNENLSKKDLKVNFSYYSTNEKDINAELAKKKIGRGRKKQKRKRINQLLIKIQVLANGKLWNLKKVLKIHLQ